MAFAEGPISRLAAVRQMPLAAVQDKPGMTMTVDASRQQGWAEDWEMRLGNRVAVITGSGSGIGRASVRDFAKEGARVVLADINGEGARETVRLIEAAGGTAMAVET